MAEEQNELEESQQQLEGALNRARMGEDKDLAAKVRDDGERLVRLLYGLLKLTELHVLENSAFDKPIKEFIIVGKSLSELLGTIHLVTVEDQVFVNDIRIRFGRAQNASSLSQELSHHEVGGFSMHDMPNKVQMREIVALLAGPALGEPPRASLIGEFSDRGYDFIDLLGVYRFRISGEGAGQVKKDAEKVSSRAAQLVEESWDNLSSNRMPNPLPLRRAVTDILEHSGDDVMGFTMEPKKGNPYGSHSVRVCRLALLLAREAGLSEEAVQDLGVSAMFHDMGYTAREGADPEKGEEGFPPPYERHAAAGARILLKQRGFHQAKINRALATLQHHWDYNSSQGRPFIYARILRIAEDFANMTRRSGGGMNPHEALSRMAAGSATRYDPFLLQLFINKLGKYPPGTLLEVEIVLKGRPMIFVLCSSSLVRSKKSFDKPICRLIRLHDGRAVPEKLRDRAVDLLRKGKVLGVLNDW